MDTKHASPRDLLSVALGAKNPTKRLEAIDALRRRLTKEEDEAVFAMRLHGATWEAIARARGTTTQAAHKRYARSAGLVDKLAAATQKADRP